MRLRMYKVLLFKFRRNLCKGSMWHIFLQSFNWITYLIWGCNNIYWNIFGTLSLYLDLFPTVEWCPVSWIVPRMSARLSSRPTNQILSQRHRVLAPFHYPTTLRQWDNLGKEQLETKAELKSRLSLIIYCQKKRCNGIPTRELIKYYLKYRVHRRQGK